MFVVITGRLGWHCRYSPFAVVWGSYPGLSGEFHLENQPKLIKVSPFAEGAAGKQEMSNFIFFIEILSSEIRPDCLQRLEHTTTWGCFYQKALVLWGLKL